MKTLEETERQTNLRVVEKMIVEIYKDSGEWRPGDVEDGSGERERGSGEWRVGDVLPKEVFLEMSLRLLQ